jgi:hypothetical protein
MSTYAAIALRYLGLTVRVESTAPQDLAWLEEFLVPPFELVDGTTGDCAVSCEVDAERHAALLSADVKSDGATLACFALEQRPLQLPVWTSLVEERRVYDAELNVFYSRPAGAPRVQLLTPPGNPAARIALMRAVREFAINHAWRSAGLVVHAAAFAMGDDGFLLAGPKGAGKTSLLTHLLRHPDARFLAGDRVHLALGDDSPVIRGLPTLVSVRAETLAMFPELRDRLAARAYQHELKLGEAPGIPVASGRWAGRGRSLSPAQFCDLLGVTRAAEARLGAVLFPRVTRARGPIELEPLSAEQGAARLVHTLFPRRLSGQAPGLFDLDVDPPASEASLGQQCRAVASQVPCFECRLGLDAYADPAGIDLLLEPLRG